MMGEAMSYLIRVGHLSFIKTEQQRSPKETGWLIGRCPGSWRNFPETWLCLVWFSTGDENLEWWYLSGQMTQNCCCTPRQHSLPSPGKGDKWLVRVDNSQLHRGTFLYWNIAWKSSLCPFLSNKIPPLKRARRILFYYICQFMKWMANYWYLVATKKKLKKKILKKMRESIIYHL